MTLKKGCYGVLVFSFVFISIMLFSTSGLAANLRSLTKRVPTTAYPTIQAAIDAAEDGDTVLVADGTYTGQGNKNISFDGKHITLKSASGPSKCIIDLQGSGRGFEFYSLENWNSVLSGFSIVNGDCGIYICCESAPTIINCVIRIDMNSAIGIDISNANPTISGCTIYGNDEKKYKEGINIGVSSVNITNCEISNTETGIDCYSSTLTITNCNIKNNSGGIDGSSSTINLINSTIIDGESRGIVCNGCQLNITSSNIYGNNDSGIDLASCSSVNITSSNISSNISGSFYKKGGGIYSSNSHLVVTNCLFNNNVASTEGGAIYSVLSEPKMFPVITNCTFVNNKASSSGGGVRTFCGIANITNSIFWNNSPDQIDGNGIVTYSDVQGGYPGTGNINTNPVFVSSTDYHLKSNSPCIDKGTAIRAPNTDNEGNRRPQGPGYDVGAYEVVSPVAATFSSSSGVLSIPYVLIDNKHKHSWELQQLTGTWNFKLTSYIVLESEIENVDD